MKHQFKRRLLITLMLAAAQLLLGGVRTGTAQVSETASDNRVVPPDKPPDDRSLLVRYVDPANGMTADEAILYALEHNGELQAARKETKAARALVKQARLRPNPQVDVSRSEQVGGTDNNTMVSAMLPLELGGRRAARINVAEREVETREALVADRERQLAAEVRAEFGAALAEVSKLRFTEELLAATERGYRLVNARVAEGRTPPLERNMTLVELNRVRSMRETDAGRVEVALLELRNVLGMTPEEPLRLHGDFRDMLDELPPLAEATERALKERPDLRAARAAETLAAAQVEQARAAGRIDASLTAGYGRMKFGFPLRGINAAGQLAPVQDVFHSVNFGVSLNLPVRNKNQGAVEAAVSIEEAARKRREFLELTVRREVAAAYARYSAAARAMEIFRVGVREQANQNLGVVQQTYELGAKTLLDYIAEQRRFIETENGYIDALLETYLARVEVKRATATATTASRTTAAPEIVTK